MGTMLSPSELEALQQRTHDSIMPDGKGADALRSITAEAFLPALALVPAAASLVAALAAPRRHRTRNAAVAAAGALAGLGLFRWQFQRLFTEQPNYLVERRLVGIEIRRYPTLVQAVTTVDGVAFDDGLDAGFSRLAGYIFGGNTVREHDLEESHVPLRSAARPGHAGGLELVEHPTQERIAMTAPVTAYGAANQNAGPSATRGVTVAFTLPAGRPLTSFPVPSDPSVRLRSVPSRRVAALRFTGLHGEVSLRRKERELIAKVKQAGFTSRGEPMFAGYDPPTTFPMFRRNEVWIEVR